MIVMVALMTMMMKATMLMFMYKMSIINVKQKMIILMHFASSFKWQKPSKSVIGVEK